MILHSGFGVHVSFPSNISLLFCLSCVRLRSLYWTLVHDAVGYTAEPLLSGLETEKGGWGSHDDIDFECSRYQFSFKAVISPSSTA